MDNFIYSEFLIDLNLCDEIVAFHKDSPNKIIGTAGFVVNKEFKDSTDVALTGDLCLKYVEALQKIVNSYIEKYPSCNMYSPWSLVEPICVQHYQPNGGFKIWHTERSTARPTVSARHLVFMTYLNDVTDQGGTEFMNQKLTINAEKGKTLIWPVDWTHTHRGVVSPSQEKYVVTGWFGFTG